MKELESIVKNLNKIGNELYNKFGTDSYNIRCELHDIKEQVKAINYTHSCETLNEGNYEHVLTFKEGKLISDKFIKIE